MDKNEQCKQDQRISCKYGVECYQKNPAHHVKYKHPSKKRQLNAPEHSRKKHKAEHEVATKKGSDSEDYLIQDDSDNNLEKCSKEKEQKVNNDVSDSDDESSQGSYSDAEKNSSKSEDISVNTIEETVSTKDSKIIDIKLENHTEDTDNDATKDKHVLSGKELEWFSFIERKFLVKMPKDFFQFWNFCEKLKPNKPLEAFKDVGLYLVGPFDVPAGKFSNVTKTEAEYLIHWRYYRDPPEFQTILRSDDSAGYHMGYFRDAPEELPVFLASNSPKKNGILTTMGGNIFSAVNIFLEDLKGSGNPFRKMAIGKLQTALTKEADRLKVDMSKKTKAMIAREKKIVSRTFNKIGLCVPYNKKSRIGYRELAQSNKELEGNFTGLQNAKNKEEKQTYLTLLQPVFTYASIATDECDFGTGIELGWNIISHGVDSLNATAEQSLVSNYRLLNMEAFAKIAEAHMKNRKQDYNLGIL